MSPFWPEGELRARPLPSAVAAGAERAARSLQFAFWPFATFRVDAVIEDLPMCCFHGSGFVLRENCGSARICIEQEIDRISLKVSPAEVGR